MHVAGARYTVKRRRGLACVQCGVSLVDVLERLGFSVAHIRLYVALPLQHVHVRLQASASGTGRCVFVLKYCTLRVTNSFAYSCQSFVIYILKTLDLDETFIYPRSRPKLQHEQDTSKQTKLRPRVVDVAHACS